LQLEEYRAMGKPIDSMTRNRKRHISGIRRYFACCILGVQAELLQSSGGAMLDDKKLASVSENWSKYARGDAIARAADVAIEVSKDRREETASMIDDVLN
jgi:hypothetical protein